MSRNIFRSKAFSEVQNGAEPEPSTSKATHAQSETEQALTDGYRQTLSPFHPDFQPRKQKQQKKPLTPEQKLDNVIARENADPWERLRISGKLRAEALEKKMRKEAEDADEK
jgi:hypothetical protein